MKFDSVVKMCFLVFLITASGCAIHYKGLTYSEQTIIETGGKDRVSYRVKKLPVFATDKGLQAIEDSLAKSKLFKTSEEFFDETIPKDGFYILVEPKYKTPTVAGVAFGYLSVTSLTLLPAWSNHDGYTVTYSVYENGELIKAFQYDRERFIALWAPILPFSWINLFTSSEYDAFYSITNEFLVDLERFLNQ